MDYSTCRDKVVEYGRRERAPFWANFFGVTTHQIHSFFNHHKDLKAKYLEIRHGKSEPIRDFIEKDGGKHTYKEWAALIGFKAYDVSNAVARFPHLEKYIILERIRNYHKFPEEWDRFIIENSGKYTCSELDKIFGVKEGTVNSHCNKRNPNDMWKHTKKYADRRQEDILEKFAKIKYDLPLPKAAVVELVGYLSAKDHKLIEEIFGYQKKDIYSKPKIEHVLKTIAEHPVQESMTYWSKLFDINLSHVSRMVHSHNLLHKIKPHKSTRSYDKYNSVNCNKRHNIDEIELPSP